MTLFVGVPFTVIAVRGRAFLQAAVAQLYVAVGALIVSAIVATEWPLVLWALVIALETMIIAGLPSPRLFKSVRPSHQGAHRAAARAFQRAGRLQCGHARSFSSLMAVSTLRGRS
jgi:hypothetical protein